MKHKYIHLIFLGLFSLGLQAQVPGYMGKRFSVGYSNNFSPSLINPDARGSEVGFNSTHEFNIEYTIKNRTNMCLMYQFLNTSVSAPSYTRYETGYNGWQEEVQYTYKGSMPYELSTKCYGLGFKFFKKGILAPVGKYTKWDFILLFSKLSYNKNNFYSSMSDPTDVKTLGTGDYSYTTFQIGLTLGTQRVLFNRVILDYGIKFGIMPASILTYINSDVEFVTNDPGDIVSVNRRATNYRLFGNQVINAHIGLSFLAF